MSKFSDYLKKETIDPRRVIAASKKLEALQPADRTIRLTRRMIRKSEDAKDKEKKTEKPAHTGRPVRQPTMAYALTGKPVSGAAKTRILRAVNSILKEKKKSEAALKDLF
jgi:hypothetical protein